MVRLFLFLLLVVLSLPGKSSVISDYLLQQWMRAENCSCFTADAPGPTLHRKTIVENKVQSISFRDTFMWGGTITYDREGSVISIAGGQDRILITYDSLMSTKGMRRIRTAELIMYHEDRGEWTAKFSTYAYNRDGSINTITVTGAGDEYYSYRPSGPLDYTVHFSYTNGWPTQRASVTGNGDTSHCTYNALTGVIAQNNSAVAHYISRFTNNGAGIIEMNLCWPDTLKPGDHWFRPLNNFDSCYRDEQCRIIRSGFPSYWLTTAYDERGLPVRMYCDSKWEAAENYPADSSHMEYEIKYTYYQ